MPAKQGKILVVRGGAIGDFILTLPALAALRNAFPETHLEVLGYPKVAELARAAGLIDSFRSIEARALARFFARHAAPDPEWAEYFASFHLIISYLYDPDDIFKSNIGRTSKAQFIQAQHRPDEAQDTHATAVFLKPLEQLALFDADPVPRISLPSREPLPSGNWVAVHPGSGSEKKNWPESHWTELLRSLGKENILLIGGEAEGQRLVRLRSTLSAGQLRSAESLPLADLGGLLAQCQKFVGHDSGITHLAASLGVPVLALWGPSRAQIWKPLGSRVALLEGPSGELGRLEVRTVQSALERM